MRGNASEKAGKMIGAMSELLFEMKACSAQGSGENLVGQESLDSEVDDELEPGSSQTENIA